MGSGRCGTASRVTSRARAYSQRAEAVELEEAAVLELRDVVAAQAQRLQAPQRLERQPIDRRHAVLIQLAATATTQRHRNMIF